jgi:hypothetical protein
LTIFGFETTLGLKCPRRVADARRDTGGRMIGRSWRRFVVVISGVALLVAASLTIASADSSLAPAAIPQANARAFVGLTPTRVLDTRVPIGVSVKAPLGAGATLVLPMVGTTPVPSIATGVAINVTLDADATSKSFLTIWPTGQARPNSSANNAEPGLISPNFTFADLGSDGSISIFNERGAVNVIIDVVGYLVPISEIEGLAPSALSAYNDAGGATPTVANGTPVPFNTAGPVVGNAIVKTDVDTFTLTAAGTYRIHYRISTAAVSLLGGAAITINGTTAGPTSTLIAAGNILADSLLVTAVANSTLELVVQGAALTLGSGSSATIVIERVI